MAVSRYLHPPNRFAYSAFSSVPSPAEAAST